MCRSREGRSVQATMDQLAVRAYGDTAIVTGRTTATAPVALRLRFTDVFVRRNGRWLVVASHATRIPD